MTPSADRYQPGQPVFVHVPKTGGSSVRLMFGSKIWAHGHDSAEKVRERLGDRFDAAWSFGFVRNPWDRAVSWYWYSRMGDRVPLTGDGLKDHFETWCRRDAFECFEPDNRSACRMLTDPETGQLLVDRVYRFEHFEWSVSAIRRKMGLDQEKIAHVNRSPRRPTWLTYQDHFTDWSRRYIEHLGQWEIRAFGYWF